MTYSHFSHSWTNKIAFVLYVEQCVLIIGCSFLDAAFSFATWLSYVIRPRVWRWFTVIICTNLHCSFAFDLVDKCTAGRGYGFAQMRTADGSDPGNGSWCETYAVTGHVLPLETQLWLLCLVLRSRWAKSNWLTIAHRPLFVDSGYGTGPDIYTTLPQLM